MRLASRFVPLALFATLVSSPAAADAPDGARFAATFGEVCIPQRLNYKATLALAQKLGWKKYVTGADAKVDHFLANAKKRLEEENAASDVKIREEMTVYARQIDGRPQLLAVTLALSEIIDMTGCYLYDFAATGPIDAEHVTKLLNHQMAYSTDGLFKDYAIDPKLMVSFVWGPSPRLPRSFDTYLTYVPEGSPVVAEVGFTGLVLKFSNSLPKPAKKKR